MRRMRSKRANQMNDATLQRISKILSESIGETLYPVSESVESRAVCAVANGVYIATDVKLKFSNSGEIHG